MRESLLFRYLGVPIHAKRIFAAPRNCLVDKMTAKIKVSSTKNISYSGRVQLINVVLMSIHGYWAHFLFIFLPVRVIKKMKVFVELTCGLEISSPLRVVMWLGRSYVIVKPQVIKV